MSIHIYNTRSQSKEEFIPLHDRTVTMYVCGVTPYDDVHLGHARVYVTFDVIRRHLGLSGYAVTYIQNFTDVDDKIIHRAADREISPARLAQTYIDDYFLQMDRLGVRRADAYPRVTQSIPQIVSFIETLVNKKKAYVTARGDVYFDVRKFSGYGNLAKRDLEDLKSGARVEVDEQKKDPLDFALWKHAKETEPADVRWPSPWGEGRPGWHIECSVMATSRLGPTIDIHGGGQDLIFPHHENEIAQSEAATGKPFVRYWIHNGFVTINREKMSKSLGNFFTLRDIFGKYPPRVVRYFLLSQHYRTPLDFSDDKLKAAAAALDGIDEVYRKLSMAVPKDELPDKLRNLESDVFKGALADFREALDDDFNTEKALAVIHRFKKEALSQPPDLAVSAQRTLQVLLEDYLGIPAPAAAMIPKDVLKLKEERELARRNKEWKRSDELRTAIDAKGYRVQDNPDGTSTVILKN